MAIALATDLASAEAVPAYIDRVSRIIYDFEANGVTDATDVISYDAQGRHESAAYVYTDDGTADRGCENFETTQTYTGSRLTRVDFGQVDDLGASVNENFATFSYAAGGNFTLIENRHAGSGAGTPLIASIGMGTAEADSRRLTISRRPELASTTSSPGAPTAAELRRLALYFSFVPGTGVRQIQYCPEPSLAGALGFGGLALASARRRNRNHDLSRN